MTPDFDLLTPLKRYWGYESFRPLQERIVRSLLGGHDVCAVMPTGGGKSLCYQLPAVVLGQTTIVISPLIALMQDQAAQLAQMGIPAAVINSSQASGEQRRVIEEARRGRYRLLYLSPERLARGDSLDWLKQVPVGCFAIDEAHCISEWGHEFRPEYRQLSALRAHFPETPIAAFTASATRPVRHDILAQLKLRDPHKYILSFHRANLRYIVKEADAAEQRRVMVRALREYDGQTVIVYAPTIRAVEETVEYLADKKIQALPYHGQMETSLRQRNQERWTSDEVRVMVGTLAFGLGINKPAVRVVIHLALPKSVEQYYQEAGRAGRDGVQADCVLLWRKRDTALLAHFIGEMKDEGEQRRAWQRWREVKQYVDAAKCRHRQICEHFGETPKWEACGGCDVCAGMPEWMTARRGEKAEEQKKEKKVRAAKSGPPRPLPDEDGELREYLREWRRQAAQRLGGPAFLVLTDAALEDLCRKKPQTVAALLQVNGIGEKKVEQFGRQIFDALERFRRGERASTAAKETTSPAEETVRLLGEGKSIAEIAEIRGRQVSTVVGLLAELVERRKLAFDPKWVDAAKIARIEEVCARLGVQGLKPLRDALPAEIIAEEIRLVVARVRAGQQQEKTS